MASPDYERAARYLFDLLDDIDTVSDVVKGNDAAYRVAVERIQRRRFDVATADGYAVIFYDVVQRTQEG